VTIVYSEPEVHMKDISVVCFQALYSHWSKIIKKKYSRSSSEVSRMQNEEALPLRKTTPSIKIGQYPSNTT